MITGFITLKDIIISVTIFGSTLLVINGMQDKRKKYTIAILLTYLYLVIAFTLINREVTRGVNVKIDAFWTITDIIENGNVSLIPEIVLNIILFMPLGYCLSILTNHRWWIVLISAVILTYFIEIMQYKLHRGLFELVDDPMYNIIGALLGGIIAIIVGNKRK